MSEIVNEAAIKVSLDASGVEEGAAKIERVAAKTGKTLESLGGGAAFKNVGEGAGAAAGQIDRATATMAASIQRTTAAMSAGAKGTADYYAALANSRGLNIATLRPYLDQLDAVSKKTALAAEAQRQLETSTRFLDGLRSQADGIGKTASQLAALRAEQLGVAEAARPFIDQLRDAEEAASGAESSFGGLAQAVAAIGLGGGIAAVAQLSDQYGQYISQLKLATDGQTEFVNAQVSVRRIATTAQSDLSATASLYSNITKGTRELGIAQRQVADITESVSLALKVSGASGAEASSAILQLSQAFASGVLRGDEFNSVNEAAPRLMQALADGIGVPTGALRKMAEEGELTTAILSDALPRALGTLRDEAKSVETIGGAYTVLKNNILEMVGATAQSNGVVATLSSGINLLAENLTLAAGAMGTLAAVKLGTALAAATREAYASVAANQARLASNLAAARADVTATASASALAAARVAELRASVLAADGAVALAIATNGLIPAQARATAAAAAHTAALSAQTAAMGAASIAGRAASGAMALLGGPVGAVVGLLGIAATAWAVWGSSAEKAEEKVSESTKASTAEVLESLDKQIAKLRERNRLNEMGFKPAEVESPAGARLGEVVAEIDRAGKGIGEYVNKDLSERVAALKALGTEYGQLTTKIAAFNLESEKDAANKAAKSAGDWMQKYATSAEKMSVELAKAKKELGSAFTPELEARIRKQFEERTAGAGKEVSAYKSLSEAINERAAATAREAASLAPLMESQKLQARIDGEVASGKLKLTVAQKASLQSRLGEIAANEEVIASQKRAAQGAADWLKIQKEHEESAKRTIDTAVKEAERNEELARTFGLTKSAIEGLELARLQEQLAQRSSLGLTLDEIENLEKLIDAKKRSAAALASVEAQEGTKTAAEKAEADWKRAAESIEQSLTDALLRGFESGKSFGRNLVDTLKNMFSTLVLRPVVQGVMAPVAGALVGGIPGAAQAAGGGAGGALSAASTLGGMAGLLGAGGLAGSVMAGAGWLTGATTLGGSLAAAGSLAATGTLGGIASSLGMAVGALGPIALGIGAVATILKKGFSMGPREVTRTSLDGTFGAGGFAGNVNEVWKQEGGWFRSDKGGVTAKAVEAELVTALNSTYDALKTSTVDYAKVLGVQADYVLTRSQNLSVALTGDQAKDQQAIADFFGKIGNDIAVELVPSLTSFAKAGEAASATLQRVATGYSAVDQALWAIGVSFGAVGTASLEARERLLAAAGGLEAFAANTAGFQQNFLTEAERNAPVLKSVTEQLGALGLSAVDTRDEFKAVVLGLDLTTEAGAKQYGALMKLQAAFAQLYPAIDASTVAAERAAAAMQQRAGLQDELDQLTMSSAQLLAKQRDALDESNRPLFDQIQALKAYAQAQESAAQATQDRAANLLSGVDSAFSALQTVVGREKALLQEVTGKHQALAQALRGTLDSMSVSGQEREDRLGAQAQIRAALAIAKASGVLPDADKLRGALSVLGKDSSALFATQQDYLRDFYSTQNDIAALAGFTDDALTVEEQSLKALDGILDSAQQQINALKGVDYSVFSLAEAIRGWNGALSAAKADPVASAGGSIASLYKELLGRPADSAGLDYWKNAVAGGLSLDEVRKMIMQGAEYKGLRGFAVGTNFVPTNMPAMIHEGERIIPAADNRELMRRLSSPNEGNAALVAEVRALRTELEGLRTEGRATATHTEKTARLLGRVIKEDTLSVKVEAE